MEVKHLRSRLDQIKGQKQALRSRISELRQEIEQLQQSFIDHEEAREIIREVGLKTQSQLQYHISDITSLALEAVFPDPYQLKVEFVQRRNKTECDLLFVRGDMEVDPLESSGYGAVDVAAFALRVASWSMQQPRSRNLIILDEPMGFLSTNFQPAASRMIKELSERLGIQFIIVTHEDILTEHADRIFVVEKGKDGISKVIVI
jgi:DNA repair exonuclease SbcCD ATPase subunit